MGLCARERQALCSIEDRLALSDPGLSSLLAVFTRLTAGEAFPARESIPEHLPDGGLRRRLAWPLLFLVMFAALISVALVVSHAGGEAVCTASASACSAKPYAGLG